MLPSAINQLAIDYPSNIVTGTRAYKQIGESWEDRAVTIPFTVRGNHDQGFRIVDDPYETPDEFHSGPASLIRAAGYLVLPADFSGVTGSNRRSFTYVLDLELPASAKASEATVHIGVINTVHTMLGDLAKVPEEVIVGGTHQGESLTQLTAMSLFEGVELLSTELEASNDDFYHSRQLQLGYVDYNGKKVGEPIDLPFTKEESQRPEIRNNIIFGQRGIPRVHWNGRTYLAVTFPKGYKLQFRMTLAVG